MIEPLHSSRRGHRLAGEWLARQADAPGPVLDTRGWTGLYSGRSTYRYDRACAALGDPDLAYVVLERRELDYGSRRSLTLQHLLEVAAQPVAVFPGTDHDDRSGATVHVYRWYPQRFSRSVADSRQRAAPRPTVREGRRAAADLPADQRRS
jgi:hypothetical protein